MLSQEAIAQVFSLLPVSKVTLGSGSIIITITDRIRVEFSNGMSRHMNVVLDGIYKINLTREDIKAFTDWLKANRVVLQAKAISSIENKLDETVCDLDYYDTKSLINIGDYI